MIQETQEIEVEVIEIDGVSPPQVTPHSTAETAQTANWKNWYYWRGRARQIPGPWVPVFLVLGVVALVFALTVGLVIGAVFITVRLLVHFIKSLLR